MTTRRQVIKAGIVLGAGAFIPLTAWRALAAVQVPQTPLPGANIPQFVEPLMTFAGNRVTSTSLTVRMLEFQQKILPASLYSGLQAPFNGGTYVWGYKVDS